MSKNYTLSGGQIQTPPVSKSGYLWHTSAGEVLDLHTKELIAAGDATIFPHNARS